MRVCMDEYNNTYSRVITRVPLVLVVKQGPNAIGTYRLISLQQSTKPTSTRRTLRPETTFIEDAPYNYPRCRSPREILESMQLLDDPKLRQDFKSSYSSSSMTTWGLLFWTGPIAQQLRNSTTCAVDHGPRRSSPKVDDYQSAYDLTRAIIMLDIGMISIYCSSWLSSRFPIAIDKHQQFKKNSERVFQNILEEFRKLFSEQSGVRRASKTTYV
jgi:hypothetical protein